MTDPDIDTKLTALMRDTFNEPNLVLRDDMTAADVPAWDSLSHIDLVMAVEKGFGIRLTTREVRGMKNVGDLKGLIRQKTA